ncbi:hypothetical protein RsTz2092_00110 [Deferribacterales bacterium RsTz2092]|nr:hypothetical protein AGMMS49941_00400 [Deferribacterales bacterium]
MLLFVSRYPQYKLLTLVTITISNSLGSLTSYWLARFVSRKKPEGKAVAYIERYGAGFMFFAWVPVLGDALPLAAGWLKMPFAKCALFITLGKLARYTAILFFGVKVLFGS